MFTLTNAYNAIATYNRSFYRTSLGLETLRLAETADGYELKRGSRIISWGYRFPLTDADGVRFSMDIGVNGGYGARWYKATYTGTWQECDCGTWQNERDLLHRGFCDGCGCAWDTCHECGSLIAPGTGTHTADGYDICDGCLDNLFWATDEEDWYWSADGLYLADDTNEYFAWSDGLFYCERNWEYYADTDNIDRYYCEDCHECDCIFCASIIRSWHDHKDDEPIYWDSTGVVSAAEFPGGVGCEIEIDYSDFPDSWSRTWHNETAQEIQEILGANRCYFEHDSSLNDGFEIITQPHSRHAWEGLLPRLGDALARCKARGYRAYDFGTCGLHIHMSRTLFGKTDWERIDTINKVCALYEIHAQEIIALAKRDYKGGCAGGERFHFDAGTREEICQEARGRNYAKEATHNRYQAINLSNRHTVEFRLARGTLRLGRIADWVAFHFNLIARARRTSWDSLPFIEFEELGNLD